MNKPLVVAIVDASGSARREMNQSIERQLREYAQTFRVRVLEHDIKVQASYEFEGRLKMATPGGGTCIQEALMSAMVEGPSLILIFTDGYLAIPKLGPACPVLWHMTEKSSCGAAWGTKLPVFAWS